RSVAEAVKDLVPQSLQGPAGDAAHAKEQRGPKLASFGGLLQGNCALFWSAEGLIGLRDGTGLWKTRPHATRGRLGADDGRLAEVAVEVGNRFGCLVNNPPRRLGSYRRRCSRGTGGPRGAGPLFRMLNDCSIQQILNHLPACREALLRSFGQRPRDRRAVLRKEGVQHGRTFAVLSRQLERR